MATVPRDCGWVREIKCADAARVVLVWLEPGDAMIRGRVVSVPAGRSFAARGVEELVAAVRAALDRLEAPLAPGDPR